MSIKIGDIIEIETNKGLAYAIYTHHHTKPPRFGALIRIFDGLYSSRPSRFEEVVTTPIRFSTFLPVQAALNKDIVRVIAHVPVPKTFPLFRSSENAIQIRPRKRCRHGGCGMGKSNGESAI